MRAFGQAGASAGPGPCSPLQGAYAEAKEAMAAVRVAVACGALTAEGARSTLDGLDHVAAVLHLKRTRPR
ncbi:MAG: hypothetical protein R3B40_04910 [Polyangiales bacterium]|nr:hypothetical protein [Myxococcales bacterium]